MSVKFYHSYFFTRYHFGETLTKEIPKVTTAQMARFSYKMPKNITLVPNLSFSTGPNMYSHYSKSNATEINNGRNRSRSRSKFIIISMTIRRGVFGGILWVTLL